MSRYLPTYLPIYLPVYLSHLPTYLSIYHTYLTYDPMMRTPLGSFMPQLFSAVTPSLIHAVVIHYREIDNYDDDDDDDRSTHMEAS